MGHHDHGGIIRTVGPTKNMSKKPGQWNKMIVTCKGHHLQVNLNGEKIIDHQLDKKYYERIKKLSIRGYDSFLTPTQTNKYYERSKQHQYKIPHTLRKSRKPIL
jgi:hypothetical protein